MNTVTVIDSAWRDLKYGARLLRVNPAFAWSRFCRSRSASAPTPAIFQLLDAVRIRTLPVRDAGELAEVRIADPNAGRTGPVLRPPPEPHQPDLGAGPRSPAGVQRGVRVERAGLRSHHRRGGAHRAGLWVSGDFIQRSRRRRAHRPHADHRRRSARLQPRRRPSSATASGSASTRAAPRSSAARSFSTATRSTSSG